MNQDIKKIWPLAAISIVVASSTMSAARKSHEQCPPRAIDGPNQMVNPPVRPYTSDPCCCEAGEVYLTASALYWNTHQDGMEYAVLNERADTQYQGLVVNAKYLNPDFKWRWGWKVGIGYNSTHDGWNMEAIWTHYKGRASRHDDTGGSSSTTLLPLWSAFAPAVANPVGAVATQGILFATDIEASWKLRLDIADFTLGRQFWTSKFFNMKPFIGIRAAWIRQDFEIEHKGGSWGATFNQGNVFNNEVDLDNHYKGVGVRAGIDSSWNFTKAWSLFGNFALSILYGRFDIEHDERNFFANAPFNRNKIHETSDGFRASKAILDLMIGIQYVTVFSDYRAFMVSLGWEHHLFFNQNQLWRVVRIGDASTTAGAVTDQFGENVFHQRRGDLSTQGWTLTATYVF
ncbi:MAG: Lpg1974 family pore-forming outer membrane protein [Chlamydiae bacterium]|nr:Lpg1974 family pore-forming outer membrane protein [Chlamydiota bacterium]